VKPPTVAYIGDAVTAAGFRMAGVRTWSPAPGEEAAALAQARREAGVVLLSGEVAAALPAAQVDGALAALQPLVAIVPEPDAALSPLDPAGRVRAQLGLER
jgi:vacuolar-type H+-ATPase subunit F/Vma7